MTRTFAVALLHAPEGGYTVQVPALRGCWTEGDTVPECLDRAREAIEGFLECLQAHGEPIPEDNPQVLVDLGDAPEALLYRVTVHSEEAAAVV